MNKARIYVSDLAVNVTDEMLTNHAQQYASGPIIKSRVILNSMSQSIGIGYVEFSTEREAHKAAFRMHQSDLAGRKIYVDDAVTRGHSNGGDYGGQARQGQAGYGYGGHAGHGYQAAYGGHAAYQAAYQAAYGGQPGGRAGYGVRAGYGGRAGYEGRAEGRAGYGGQAGYGQNYYRR